jgi:hypothetical protein
MRTLATASWRALAVAVALTSAGLISTSLAQAQAPDNTGCTPQERSNLALQDANKNAGVICPPDIDPAMRAPAPKTGDEGMASPPGSSGAPGTQPK